MKGPKNNKKAPLRSGMSIPGVDVAQIESLLEFMSAHRLEEFEYQKGDLHIRLKKVSTGSAPGSASASKATAQAAPAAAASATEAAPEAAGTPPGEDLHVIKSPIVGTFYAAASPEAPAFVKPGDSIQAGQVVCIIEAMKLMNEIEADISGKVARILAENGQPVEYGQPLFAISPAKK